MKGHNSAKNHRTGTKFELDLYLIMVKLYTKYHINTSKHNEKKCGKLICRTDGRTDGRSANLISPFFFEKFGMKKDVETKWHFLFYLIEVYPLGTLKNHWNSKEDFICILPISLGRPNITIAVDWPLNPIQSTKSINYLIDPYVKCAKIS